MNTEQMLYSALVIITGWLGVTVKILWGKSVECEGDRRKMNGDILGLTGKMNLLQGQLDAMKSCPQVECPMRRATEKTRSGPISIPAQ